MGGEAYIRGRMAIGGVERQQALDCVHSFIEVSLARQVMWSDTHRERQARLDEYDRRQALAMTREPA